MTTTTTSTTISTATVSTSRAVPSAGPLAPTSGSLNAEHLATTSLAELNDAAGLLTRVDRKYLVPLERAQELVGGLSSEAQVLEIDGRRRFSYASTYFDTPGLEAFMLTARKRRRRFKVRTRTYLDSGLCFLEVKTRGARGTTVKRRMGYHPDDASRLTGSGRAFVAACLASTGVAVVETKNPATPSPADRTLWDAGYRPARISKYATGMALLHPELPANRWYRTLTHELAGLFGTDRSSLEGMSAA